MGRGSTKKRVPSSPAPGRGDPLRRLMHGEIVSGRELSGLVWHHGSSRRLQLEDVQLGVAAGAWFSGFHLASDYGVAVHYANTEKFLTREEIDDPQRKKYTYRIEIDVQKPFFVRAPVHPRIRDFLEKKIRASDNPSEFFPGESEEFQEHIQRVHRGEESLELPSGIENYHLISRNYISEEDIRCLGWDCISFFVNKTAPNPDHTHPLEFATELILLDPQNQIKRFQESVLDRESVSS